MGPVPSPPALGHELPAPELRNAWLGWAEMASGLAVTCHASLSLALAPGRSGRLLRSGYLLFCPARVLDDEPGAYAVDTLIGTVIAFAVMVPPQPGISREALASPADAARLVLLAFVLRAAHAHRGARLRGLFVSRYLGAYQLGHIDGVWDPFFAGRRV